MEAVATLIDMNAPSMMDAIEKSRETTDDDKPSDLFYVLFGLCIENLSRISSGRFETSSTMVICLRALRIFIQPCLAGKEFVPKAVFLELVNVFDRLIQTEGYRVQLYIIEIVQKLTENYGKQYLCDDLENER